MHQETQLLFRELQPTPGLHQHLQLSLNQPPVTVLEKPEQSSEHNFCNGFREGTKQLFLVCGQPILEQYKRHPVGMLLSQCLACRPVPCVLVLQLWLVSCQLQGGPLSLSESSDPNSPAHGSPALTCSWLLPPFHCSCSPAVPTDWGPPSAWR